MSGLRGKQDAYGRMLYDQHRGQRVTEILERSDGFVTEKE